MAMSAELRLQAMIRSLGEVIIPALPDDQKLARDQALILLGNLRMLAVQQSRACDFEMAELREHLALAEALAAEAEGGPGVASAADVVRGAVSELKSVAALPCPPQTELTTMAHQAKAIAEALVDAAYANGSPAFRATVARLVMAQAERQIERERRWTQAAGFDPGAEALPPLDDILARGRP